MAQRKVKNIALHTRIDKFSQTPPNLHRSARLDTQGIYLPSLDEDELVLAVFAIIHTVGCAESDNGQL